MQLQSPYKTFKRYRSLQTHKLSSLPIVILMPHSACNCRCVMCDIWKGNGNLKQLATDDVQALMAPLKKLDAQQVLMSGGEALLNPNFFRLCEIIKKEKIKITLLSTGLTLRQHAVQLLQWVDDIIVSLDGDEQTHNRIRNIPGSFHKMKEGIEAIRLLKPDYKITCRTVIHRLNFRAWPQIIESARALGLNQVSFLPADVSSHAFNRQQAWEQPRQEELLLSATELSDLKTLLEEMLRLFKKDFENRFIAESPEKLMNIYYYYAAYHGHNDFPYKQCNAPWVSTVVEADGTVRPCFFHEAYGNLQSGAFNSIINSESAIHFRKSLDMSTNHTCKKCVCYLNLSPFTVL